MYEVCNNSFEFFADYVRSDEITVLCHNEADLSGIENILVLVFSCLLQEMRTSQWTSTISLSPPRDINGAWLFYI